MSTSLPRKVSFPTHRKGGRFTAAFLFVVAFVGFTLANSSALAVNHRPIITWQQTGTGTSSDLLLGRDQQITGTAFAKETFSVLDPEGSAGVTASVTRVDSVPTGWCIAQDVTPGGSYPNFTFTPVPNGTGPGSATITITTTDGTFSSSTSFTIARVATIGTQVGLVPDQTLLVSSGAVTLNFASEMNNYTTGVASSPPGIATVAPVLDQNRIHSISVTPTTTAGVATVTVTLTGPSGVTSKTSFVVTTAGGTVPGFSGVPSSTSASSIMFSVTGSPPLANLNVRATSSNPSLVPNGDTSLHITSGAGGSRTLMITPVATSGAATITLAVSDQNFTSYAQFLYVLAPSNDPNLSFTRSKGVFVLDTGNCDQNLLNCDPYCGANCTYTTKFGTTIDLRDIDLQYIDSATDGYTLRVPWASIESPDAPGVRTYQYDFKIIENAITKLENVTPNQHLSIIIQGEPAYVDTMATQKWTSAKGPRALPWDSFLRARWHALMQAMASDVIPGEAMTLADHPVLTIINPSLPGGDSGIRDLQSGMDDVPFSSTLTGYSRPVLLAAIEDYLGSIQTYFPKKMVQIGFWKVLDDDTVQGDPPLWSYLRDNLATGVTGLMDSYAEFNGVERPRVGFWQEDLGAARLNVDPEYVSAVAPPSNQQYTSTPDPTFAAPLASIGSRGWVGFQMLDSWAGFFMDSHWPKMKNGSANDAMEAAYNTYYAQYFETYAAEIDDPAQQAARARWHGYLQTLTPPLEIPAGLTVITDTLHSPVQNVVSWFPVANATAYKLERADLLNDPNSWSQVTGSPTSLTSLNDTNQITSGMQWAYRVSASSGGPYTNVSPSVTTYLSEAVNDGYVMGPKGSATPTPFPSATDPGIRAGNTQSSRELRGFLSFNTNSLGSTATVLDARLRLTQVSTNDAFDAFGTCTVAIKQGNFNNNQTLEGLDFAATPTQPNVGQVPRMDGITNWVEVRLDPLLGVPYVFTTGRTQFRLQFDGLTSAVNSAGWSAGDVHGSEPQLLVRFK